MKTIYSIYRFNYDLTMYYRGLRFCVIVLYSDIDPTVQADGARATIDTSSRFDGTESNSAGVHHIIKYLINKTPASHL